MFLAILLLLCDLAFAQKISTARAGMLYYAEGEVRVDGKNIRSNGQSRLPQIEDGQTVSSPRGHAEVLLGPGAVLWTGTKAQVRFDDTRVEDTDITILEGAVIIELARALDPNRVRVHTGALDVDLTHEGVYRVDAAAHSVRVYSGEILLSSTSRVSRGEERVDGATKPFDRKDRDEFHCWAAYRSFMLEVDTGTYKRWGGSSWGEREHSGFGVKLPDAPGAARAKYIASSEAGVVYYLEGSAVTGAQNRTASLRLPLGLGHENFIQTETGKAEVFLGVGVVARFIDNTHLGMVDTHAGSPVVSVDSGSVLFEVGNIEDSAATKVKVGDSVTELLKPGLYQFDATAGSLRVFAGEASTVLAGATVHARDSQEVNLREAAPVAKFDPKVHDALFKWSADRSFTLFMGSAGFMTQWATMTKQGWYKHKQFGERFDRRPRRGRPQPRAQLP